MKKFIVPVSLIFLMMAYLISAGGCRQKITGGDEGTPTPTPLPAALSGTLTGLPGSPGTYTVYLDTDKVRANGFTDSVSGAYAGGGTQAYDMGTVAGGRYFVYAFLDLNSNSNPEAGEYWGVNGAVYPAFPNNGTVFIDAVTQTADAAMAAMYNNISGTVTLTTDGTGATYYITLDSDGNPSTTGDFIVGATGTVSGITIAYNMAIPYPSTFHIFVAVDKGGTGDEAGTYGSLPYGSDVSISDVSTSIGPYDINTIAP